MALYVVAYPRFASTAEERWIEDLRREHDPQGSLIAAHVTLVFGVECVSTATAVAHLQAIAASRHRFAANFEAATLHQGVTDTDFYAYLLPGEGAADLVALHGALHGGPFAGHKALPYEPHLTLGRASERAAMARLVAQLNERRLGVRATVDALHLLAVGSEGIAVVAAAGLT